VLYTTGRWLELPQSTRKHPPTILRLHYTTHQVSTTFDADLATPQPSIRITADELLPLLAKQQPAGPGPTSSSSSGGGALVVDTRNAEQFTGQVRRGPRAGRIPGALSLPRKALLDETTGWLLPLQQQRQVLMDRLGLSAAELEGGGRRVVLYCNGGVAACTAALALHRLGSRDVAVYDGSWNEWGAREELPIE